jgi:cell division protein FtsB
MDFLRPRGNRMSPVQTRASFWRRHMLKILGLALLALGIHDVFGTHGYLAMRRSDKQIQELRGEIERLSHENQALAEHVNALKTDPDTIEKIAREEMGLAKPGEMIFKLPAGSPAPAADGKPSQPAGSR